MSSRREFFAISATLAALVVGFFAESLLGGKILSPADVLFVSKSFEGVRGPGYEPANRLLMDPVLQFQPWLEFNRAMLRSGRLPLWNPWSGCGAPHLANGQSAVFDPFQVIAYLGPWPDALAWMAAARLWFAGLGMFLLAKSWGLGPWGRWFSGLTFPFCGFLVGWLLYPVTNVAVWIPWVFLATEGVWSRPGPRSVGWLAIAVGGTLLGGHVQTGAHILLAAAVYSAWRGWSSPTFRRGAVRWTLGVALGLGIGAIEVVPLGYYLARSPVWGDRDRERLPAWTLARPRLLDAACTAFPSLYGSQRRGEPNLARAVGVHNQNESAGGFAGMVTLAWLAPLAWSARRDTPRVRFLAAFTAFGLLGAFRFPPVDNLLRLLPILNVTDNRRLTLWVAFGLMALGGIGLDRLAEVRRGLAWKVWGWAWIAVGLSFVAAGVGIERFAPTLREKALSHYANAARETPGADPALYLDRAERQARETLDFVPKTLGLAATKLLAMAWLLGAIRKGRIGLEAARAALLGLAMVDVIGCGFGRNPAIERADDRPEPPVIARLRSEVGTSGRIIGLGAELPPNTLMRYGLADARNYDSVELARNLDWLDPLYDPKVRARTSRREITWDRVGAARERLREAGVRAVVGPTPPPEGLGRVEQIGRVWIAWLDAAPLVELVGDGSISRLSEGPGSLVAEVEVDAKSSLVVRQTFDPGWVVQVDGRAATVETYLGTFLAVDVPPGIHRIEWTYAPIEVALAALTSVGAALVAVFALTGFGPFRFTRIVSYRLGRIQATGLESDSVTHPRTTRPAKSPKDNTLMVHFTCDLCGKDLNASGDPRYVVRIEAYAGFDPNQITEEDLDDDHMEAVSELLQRDEGLSSQEIEAQVRKGFRFDLCPTCHGKFVKDPLGREFLRSFDFSKN